MLLALWVVPACGGKVEEAPGLVPDEQIQPEAVDVSVRFVDVTAEAGLTFSHFNDVRTHVIPEDMGSGTAWGDYDDDGFLDLFVVNMSRDDQSDRPMDRGKLFRNLGNGAFQDVTQTSGIEQTGLGYGVIWFDYDADGRIDLFLTGFGWQRLYRNRGDGSFEDLTESSGLNIDAGWPTGSTVSDYDLDGDLDLYVPHYVDFKFHTAAETAKFEEVYSGLDVPYTLNPLSYQSLPNHLYRNNGDGTFSDATKEAQISYFRRSLQAVFCDFNSDGLPDLFVANDTSPDALFINQGDGTFKDVAEYARTADSRGSMGVAIGDFDRDLDQDIWVTHWIAQDDALFRNMSEGYTGGVIRFIDEIAPAVGEISLGFVGFGVVFFDYDNDGWLDISVANGSMFENSEDKTQLRTMKNLLFRNQGDRKFALANETTGQAWETENVGRSLSFADYDNDGDLDLLVMAWGEGVRLLRNDGGSDNNWLTLDLDGPPGNRQAVGARVVVSAGDTKQLQDVLAGTSYLSMSDIRPHFGLGENEKVDWVEIHWPDGEIQRLEGIAANQILAVTKP